VSDDFIFTSESMTAGHPDKLCDQVSDAIVDHYLMADPNARIVAESVLASGVMFISTHYASKATLDIADIARQVVRSVGYPKDIFDADACTIMTSFTDHTAADHRVLDFDKIDDNYIDSLVSKHQVTVFGYACNQTKDLMPLPVWLAHRLSKQLDAAKVKKQVPYLLPDAKAQVGIEYKSGKPSRIHSLTLVASQSSADVELGQLRADLLEHVVQPVLAKIAWDLDEQTLLSVNPEGLLVGGGPAAHSGLTGRKTGVDTYGEYARHSGAALSGKDPLRVDRVGAYAARYVARNVVAAGLAEECEVALSYAVGAAGPVSVRLRTFGEGAMSNGELADKVQKAFDLRLGAIVRDFGLNKLPAQQDGFYRKLACYGQMGRVDLDAPWERNDKVDTLKA
jgi:S-adenosylmethionine synthetase